MSGASDSQIVFDAIHTQKKQQHLVRMMSETALEVHKIPNHNVKFESCVICKSSNVLFHVNKFGFNLDRCCDCGHIFCNPMPNSSQLNFYYNSPMKDFENEFFIESFEKRVPIFKKRIEIIKSFVPKGKLLDVGSAIGIFISALQREEYGFEVHCCDPSDGACRLLKEKYPEITIHQMMVEQLKADCGFDVVTMWDTLEHVESPVDVAMSIKKLLTPGGYWFFSTPNTDSFEWKVAGVDHVQLLPPGHINLFNLQSIKRVLLDADLELVEYFTPNGTLDVSYVKKLLQNGTPEYIKNAGNFFYQHIEDDSFLAAFAKLLTDTKYAGNIVVVARKRLVEDKG
ncbi:class I SAM-dependent methyltransferase [Rheinheimera sp.]|uniref:class I SAM-dependent methyltransferase n=1 Tax=Rheinheimera sp. TaxID=1869214 RepID=UPI003D299A43